MSESLPDTDYMTARNYVNANGIKVERSWSGIGRSLTLMSKVWHYEIKSEPHPRWGTVNAYHIDILRFFFSSYPTL